MVYVIKGAFKKKKPCFIDNTLTLLTVGKPQFPTMTKSLN